MPVVASFPWSPSRIMSGGLSILLLGIAGGWIAASGNVTLIALGGATAAAIALCVAFPPLVLWGIFVGGLVVAGMTQLYLPQLQAIRWVVAVGAGGLGLAAMLYWLFSADGRRKPRLPGSVYGLLAFVVLGSFSSFRNGLDLATYVYGLKGYTQAWGIILAVVFLPIASRFVDQLPRAMFAVALLQLPFVAHQYFALVPLRRGVGHGVVPEDIIAGTMGADLSGGGANAVLSALLFVVVAVLIAMWKDGVVPGRKALYASLLLLAPTVLNISKVSAVYLALLFFVLFFSDVKRYPGRVVAGAAVVGAAAGGMLLLFSYMSVDEAIRTQGLAEVIDEATRKHMSEDSGYGAFELNRWTSLTFWGREHGWHNSMQTLFGHGLGQSREAAGGIGIATTLAQQRYEGIGIGLTGVSAVLWETGLAGLAVLLGVFLSAFAAAGRLAARCSPDDRRKAAIFKGLQAGLSVLMLSLFHKNFIVMHLPYQMLVALVIAYIGHFTAIERADSGATFSSPLRDRLPRNRASEVTCGTA